SISNTKRDNETMFKTHFFKKTIFIPRVILFYLIIALIFAAATRAVIVIKNINATDAIIPEITDIESEIEFMHFIIRSSATGSNKITVSLYKTTTAIIF